MNYFILKGRDNIRVSNPENCSKETFSEKFEAKSGFPMPEFQPSDRPGLAINLWFRCEDVKSDDRDDQVLVFTNSASVSKFNNSSSSREGVDYRNWMVNLAQSDLMLICFPVQLNGTKQEVRNQQGKPVIDSMFTDKDRLDEISADVPESPALKLVFAKARSQI